MSYKRKKWLHRLHKALATCIISEEVATQVTQGLSYTIQCTCLIRKEVATQLTKGIRYMSYKRKKWLHRLHSLHKALATRHISE